MNDTASRERNRLEFEVKEKQKRERQDRVRYELTESELMTSCIVVEP
jgi:hypothetical protein